MVSRLTLNVSFMPGTSSWTLLRGASPSKGNELEGGQDDWHEVFRQALCKCVFCCK